MEQFLSSGVLINGPSGTMSTGLRSSSFDAMHTTSSAAAPTSSGKRKRKCKCKLLCKPTKRTTAYGLFFREQCTQIRKFNPHVTFGEVSKAVAEMWRNATEDVKDHYKNRIIAANENYIRSLATHMPHTTYALKKDNKSKHNVPCKTKKNDASICPQRIGAGTNETKTPRTKEASGVTRDGYAITGNGSHDAY